MVKKVLSQVPFGTLHSAVVEVEAPPLDHDCSPDCLCWSQARHGTQVASTEIREGE